MPAAVGPQDYTAVAGGNFDPKQRRNAGAPPTSELEGLMGSQSFALYDPLKPAGKK